MKAFKQNKQTLFFIKIETVCPHNRGIIFVKNKITTYSNTMTCDYYIQTELVCEYMDSSGKHHTLYTNRKMLNGYIQDDVASEDEEDLDQTIAKKRYVVLLTEKLNKNTYNKMFYDNDNWQKPRYKQKYEKYLAKFVPINSYIVKIFKKVKSYECEKW